jgi:hypothetical protein
MPISPAFQLWLALSLSGCIVEDEVIEPEVLPPEQAVTAQAIETSKIVIGSAEPDIRAVKVEVSLFETVQLNPVLAKIAKQRAKGNSVPKVCRWSRVTNKMKQSTITVFPNPCADIIQTAWHPTQTGISLVSQGKALFSVSGAEAVPLGNVSGRPFDLGVREDGTLLVRSVEANVVTTTEDVLVGIAFDDGFVAGGNGEFASVYRSYQHNNEIWELLERVVTEPRSTPPRSAHWENIGPTSTDLHPGVAGVDFEPADEALQASFASAFPTQPDDSVRWVVATTDFGDYAWPMRSGDKRGPGLPVLTKSAEGEWSPLAGLKYKITSGLTLQFRNNYLLVTRMGTRPFVVDLSSNKIIYKSIGASGVIFWPRFKNAPKMSAKTVPAATD